MTLMWIRLHLAAIIRAAKRPNWNWRDFVNSGSEGCWVYGSSWLVEEGLRKLKLEEEFGWRLTLI